MLPQELNKRVKEKYPLMFIYSFNEIHFSNVCAFSCLCYRRTSASQFTGIDDGGWGEEGEKERLTDRKDIFKAGQLNITYQAGG